MVLACVAGEQALADVMSLFPGDQVVGLTPRTLQTLRDGHPVELQLAPLGLSDFTGGFLFAGQSEFELVELLRASGLIDATTKFEGVEEYLRHERNAVEDCVFCRERRHQKNGVVFSAPAAPSWQARILAHPYLAMLGVLGVFALIGLAVALWR
ncbi:MAG: hypothetical protein Q8L14_42945 [Myxococcales bacterium]|nr:hypothetical protein [Myxococcales bacterium]